MVQQAVRVGRGLDLFVTFGTLLVVTIPRLRNDSGALGNRKGEQANLGGYAGSFRWKREMMVGLVKSFSSSFSISLFLHILNLKKRMSMRILKFVIGTSKLSQICYIQF